MILSMDNARILIDICPRKKILKSWFFLKNAHFLRKGLSLLREKCQSNHPLSIVIVFVQPRIPKHLMELCILLPQITEQIMRSNRNENNREGFEDQSSKHSENDFPDKDIARNPHPVKRLHQRSMNGHFITFRYFAIRLHLKAP